MKKVGIITFYYRNSNYGGLLQAYALQKAISYLGYNAEQIKWPYLYNNGVTSESSQPGVINNKIQYLIKEIFSNKSFKFLLYICKSKLYSILCKIYNRKIKVRVSTMEEFGEKISHSSSLYTRENIKDSLKEYRVFVAGSDQIWNMRWYNQEYFLDFVPDDTYKFSYAASMPDINMTDKDKCTVINHLKSFNSISVREEITASFLSDLVEREVECVVDPTLLLSRADWDSITGERFVENKYVFCYFLGDNKAFRNQASKFAKRLGLKIVTLPHLCRINSNDIFFGDYKLYDVGPDDFISLIKHAEYVITDSFHAVVFSNIFKIKYFAFNRNDLPNMTERIINLLEMYDSKERLIEPDVELMYKMKDISCSLNDEKYVSKKEKSLEFLKNNLKSAFGE